MADELFEIRNAYYIGNYHSTIAEAGSAKSASKKPEDIQNFNTERDALVALAQIALGQYDSVIHDLRAATQPYLVAVRLYGTFCRELHSKSSNTSKALADLMDLVRNATPNTAQAAIAVLAATASIAALEISEGIKLAGNWASKLEAPANTRFIIELRALVVDGMLRLNRPDLAEKEVAVMKTVDDESILTFLASATTSLRLGITKKEKFVEAEGAVRDAATRSSHSVVTLNLLALAYLGQGKLADAERALVDALGKRSGDPDTIANLILVASQQGKPAEAMLRHISQLKSTAPNSTWATQYVAMENRFAEAANAL
jgi:hypothetical protein